MTTTPVGGGFLNTILKALLPLEHIASLTTIAGATRMSVSGLIANSTNQLKALQLTQQAQAATEAEQGKERFIQSVTTPGPPLSW